MPDYLTREANDAIRAAQARTGLGRTEVINRAVIAYGRAEVDAKPVHIGTALRVVRKGRFLRAYRTLRRVYEGHLAAGHDVEFTAVNEGRVLLHCRTCAGRPTERTAP